MVREPEPAAVTTVTPPAPHGLPVGPAIPPLHVSGLVIHKADLVAALRIYVPLLDDLAPLDSERYLLRLATTAPSAHGGVA